MDPASELHTGPRHVTAAPEAGHMSAPDPHASHRRRFSLLPPGRPHMSMMTISPGLSAGTRLSRKDRAVDRAVEQTRSCNTIVAQGRDEGHGLPTLEWRLADHAAAARPPSAKRCHVGLCPGLIDKNQALGIDAALVFAPLFASALNVFAILFLGGCGFFYGSVPRRAEPPRPSGGRPSGRERF